MTIARLLFLLLLATPLPCGAEGPDAPVDPPNVLLKIVQAIESSKIEELTSKQGDSTDTYHLREAHFLGSVSRDNRTYTVGWMKFIRSRPANRDTPPARGHDFIVILDPDFKIVSHARVGMGPYRMEGHRLTGGGADVNFQNTEPLTRHRGYMIDGSSFLPYPFPDRITDEEWNAGTFKR